MNGNEYQQLKRAATSEENDEDGDQSEQDVAVHFENLLRDYQQVCLVYDRIKGEPYKAGRELEPLMSAFMERHREHLSRVQFEFPAEIKKLLHAKEGRALMDGSKVNESLQDDLRIMEGIKCKQIDDPETKETGDLRTLTTTTTSLDEQGRHLLLADIFCRMAEAANMRVIYQRCRHKLEQDRKEPLKWAQVALRHSPSSHKTCSYYMVAVGRYSDYNLGPRDRLLAGKAHKLAILRCLRMAPQDALAHHLLGRYYWHVAQLTWLQRAILKGSSFELEGSLADAERELRLAHELKGDGMPVGLWMARVLLARKRPPMDEVHHWIKLGLAMDVREPWCEIEREQLVELALKLGLKECVVQEKKNQPKVQ